MVSFSFLAIGKTHESTEAVDSKKYIGVGSSKVLAVNPDKKELEELLGHEVANAPEYLSKSDEGTDIVRVSFVVRTDPEQCGGIEATNLISFFVRNEGSFNADHTKMQVIDEYGNSSWALVEDAKMGKRIQHDGKDAKIAPKYRPAFRGESDLVAFLKAYLGVEDVFNYINGSWMMRDGNLDDYKFGLEHIKDYFKGDVSELREALKLQPNNKVKLLYGIRNTDRGQFQTISTREGTVLRNSAGSNALARVEKRLAAITPQDTVYQVCPLREYEVKATDFSAAPAATQDSDTDAMPWE